MGLTLEQEQMLLEYLATMKSLIYSEQCNQMVSDIKDKDIVVFIGNTRAGKSTIVNHVIGNNLKAVRIKKRHFHIVKDAENAEGPVIGTAAISETTIPTAWNSTKISGLIVDAPGFDDNRGEAQDVANAFYIKELITNANSMKFVLITDINDITNDNIGQFINFIDKIHTIFPHCDSILNGMIVVFNKDKDETTNEEMIDYLMTKIIQQDKIKLKNRSLIRHLVQNPKHFVIISSPTEEGECDDMFDPVIDSVENVAQVLPKHLLSGVTPGISDRSKCLLLEAHTYFTEMRELDELLIEIEREFKRTVIPTGFENGQKQIDELKELKMKLVKTEEDIAMLICSKASVKETLLAIGNYIPTVEQLHEGSQIYMKMDFIKFVDEILKIQESNMFRVRVDTAISKMKDQTTQCKIKLQELLFEISAEEANKKIQEMINRQNEDKIENLKKINEMQQKQIETLSQLKSQRSGGFCSVM